MVGWRACWFGYPERIFGRPDGPVEQDGVGIVSIGAVAEDVQAVRVEGIVRIEGDEVAAGCTIQRAVACAAGTVPSCCTDQLDAVIAEAGHDVSRGVRAAVVDDDQLPVRK